MFWPLLLGLALATGSVDVLAANAEAPRSLRTETFLHPMDGFTAFTLKKNEFVYNQSPLTLPLPSWAMWGVTDWLTAEVDALPLIGGLFQKPYLPVPSFNFRFRLKDSTSGFGLAYETMYQYLYEVADQAQAEHIQIGRQYSSWFHRLNASLLVSENLWLHLSGGATYAENISFRNKNRPDVISKNFSREWHPDLSFSLDWRAKPWMSVHVTPSYGSTFVYLDNVPRKIQVAYGFRFAPLRSAKNPIWRNLRIELAAFYMRFPDINEEQAVELPVFPYLYWQWQI